MAKNFIIYYQEHGHSSLFFIPPNFYLLVQIFEIKEVHLIEKSFGENDAIRAVELLKFVRF